MGSDRREPPISQPRPHDSSLKRWALACGLAGLALALYAPVRGFEFISYDDALRIVNNDRLHEGLTRESLREWNAGPGSAAVQVFPASYSPLRLLAETMRFFAEESCQKCTPCRIGNRGMHHLVEELANGEAAMTREQAEEWLDAMAATSICGLGQGAPFPMRNAFKHWPDLFEPLGEPAIR